MKRVRDDRQKGFQVPMQKLPARRVFQADDQSPKVLGLWVDYGPVEPSKACKVNP